MWRLYCNTDEHGNITDSYFGEDIVASDPFSFFFIVEKDVAMNIENFKVQIVNFQPKLVLIDQSE